MTATSFLEGLHRAARDAEFAEAAFRREVATRVAGLERDRAFAYRRLNLMKAIAEAVGQRKKSRRLSLMRWRRCAAGLVGKATATRAPRC